MTTTNIIHTDAVPGNVIHADAVSGGGTYIVSASTDSTAFDDWLLRVQQTGSGYATYTPIPTSVVTDRFLGMLNQNELFRRIIKNLWEVYKYQQEYQLFLLGRYEEQEFLRIAETYAAPFQHIPLEILREASRVLFNVLNKDLTSSDLSVLLNVDPDDIEHALSSAPGIHAVLLEPQETHGE